MITEFKEEQKFTQWWLWLILIGIALIPIFAIYKQLILGEKFGTKPLSDTGVILFAVIMFLFLLLFYVMGLRTHIDKKEIRHAFFPFVKKTTQWSDIKSAEVLDYGFVGGWGIRIWSKYGTVYNVKGSKGLAIELNNGKKFLIGTQKEDELKRVVERAKKQQWLHLSEKLS